MRDWIDAPVPGYPPTITEVFWCRQCKESYERRLYFESEVGDYGGDDTCPLCGHTGIPWSERGDEAESIE